MALCDLNVCIVNIFKFHLDLLTYLYNCGIPVFIFTLTHGTILGVAIV